MLSSLLPPSSFLSRNLILIGSSRETRPLSPTEEEEEDRKKTEPPVAGKLAIL